MKEIGRNGNITLLPYTRVGGGGMVEGGVKNSQ